MQTILVVDDERYVTRALGIRLARAGFAVVTADDGRAGYDAAVERRPDLVITDYDMPGLSGVEMCRLLRGDPRTADIPVVILTGQGHRLTPADLASLNVRCVLDKPFSIRQVLAKLGELVPAVAPAAA